MRQIRHWTVGDAFRQKFTELSALIDLDTGQTSSVQASSSTYAFSLSPQLSVKSFKSVSYHSPP